MIWGTHVWFCVSFGFFDIFCIIWHSVSYPPLAPPPFFVFHNIFITVLVSAFHAGFNPCLKLSIYQFLHLEFWCVFALPFALLVVIRVFMKSLIKSLETSRFACVCRFCRVSCFTGYCLWKSRIMSPLCIILSNPVTHSALPPPSHLHHINTFQHHVCAFCILSYSLPKKKKKVTPKRQQTQYHKCHFPTCVRVCHLTNPFCCFSQRKVMWKCTWRVVPSPCSCPKSRWTATAWKPGATCPATNSNWTGCILPIKLFSFFRFRNK